MRPRRRALRRYHYARLKLKRGRYYGLPGEWPGGAKMPGYNYQSKPAGRYATTAKPCSCMMCGNRRWWAGPTRQERKAALKQREGLEETT